MADMIRCEAFDDTDRSHQRLMIDLPDRSSSPGGRAAEVGAGEMMALPPSDMSDLAGISGDVLSKRFVSHALAETVHNDGPPRGESDKRQAPIAADLRKMIREYFCSGMMCNIRVGDQQCCECGTECMLAEGFADGARISPGLYCLKHAWVLHVKQCRGELGGLPIDENDAAQLVMRLGSVSETEAAVSDAVRRLRADARAQSELAMSLYASLQVEKRQAEEVQLGYLQQQQFVDTHWFPLVIHSTWLHAPPLHNVGSLENHES
jgi:hypothetical protein